MPVFYGQFSEHAPFSNVQFFSNRIRVPGLWHIPVSRCGKLTLVSEQINAVLFFTSPIYEVTH